MITKEDLKLIDCFTFKFNCPKNAKKEYVSLFYSPIDICVSYCEDQYTQYSGRLFDVRLQSILDNRGLPKSWLNEYAHYFVGEIDKELVRLNISRTDFITKNYSNEVIFNFDVKPFL